jgi:hypothetical protein
LPATAFGQCGVRTPNFLADPSLSLNTYSEGFGMDRTNHLRSRYAILVQRKISPS